MNKYIYIYITNIVQETIVIRIGCTWPYNTRAAYNTPPIQMPAFRYNNMAYNTRPRTPLTHARTVRVNLYTRSP